MPRCSRDLMFLWSFVMQYVNNIYSLRHKLWSHVCVKQKKTNTSLTEIAILVVRTRRHTKCLYALRLALAQNKSFSGNSSVACSTLPLLYKHWKTAVLIIPSHTTYLAASWPIVAPRSILRWQMALSIGYSVSYLSFQLHFTSAESHPRLSSWQKHALHFIFFMKEAQLPSTWNQQPEGSSSDRMTWRPRVPRSRCEALYSSTT